MKRFVILLILASTLLASLLAHATQKLCVYEEQLFAYERHIAEQQAYIARLENHIPTIKELQKRLQRRGHDLGPHGVDGRLSEATRRAWDREIYNRYAAPYFVKER
jgi:GAF domain-containing protein